MIISAKWNDKNNTFKIGEYTFNEIVETPVDTPTATKRMNYLCITAHGRVN